METKLLPVILCGGAGSRLWPVSRELHPKPFMQIEEEISLLETAVERSLAMAGVKSILIVSNHQLAHSIQHVLKSYAAQGITIYYLWEPVARNTAAAIACAAFFAQSLQFEQLLVLPADHLVRNLTAFQQAVQTAQILSEQQQLVTFGVVPQYAETGYGYIEADGHRVLRFVEKPTFEKAQEYLASGRYLWNAGIFLFPVEALLQEMQACCSDVYTSSQQAFAQREASGQDAWQMPLDAFNHIPDISIDYAVMERSQKVAVVPCDMGWSDVGSWLAIADIHAQKSAPHDARVYLHLSERTYVQPHGNRLVAAVGVQDLLIVDTADALLVAHKDHAQEVKHVYQRLKREEHPAAQHHLTVHRPWGTYTVLEEGPGFKIKKISVYPGQRLSLQLHHQRSEHWVVVEGVAKVTNGDRILHLSANESTYIPANTKHRLENDTNQALVIIEVQTGGYLEEDDIVRFEDVYGRVQ